MKEKSKKRNVKIQTPYETVFLEYLFTGIVGLVEKNETTISQMAGEVDIDLPNLLRYKRLKPNVRILNALRMIQRMGHRFSDVAAEAERKADEWQRLEDEKKKKGLI